MRELVLPLCVVFLVASLPWPVSWTRRAQKPAETESLPEVFPFPTPFDLQPPLRPRQKTALSLAPSERATSPCYRAYSRFYEKPVIEIRIVFGYKDARPARYVGDRYEALALTEYLTRPCPGSFHACGFARDPDDAESFTKTILGPDNHPRTIHLRVVHSSVGPDDDDNRANRFQLWQSHHAQETFLDGLQNADAVLYDGHSRDGGGPDFDPPRLTLDKHVDYLWYAKHQPGLKRLLDRLHHPTELKLLGLFSCLSSGLFSQKIRDTQKGLATISSRRLVYYADALEDLMGALSAVLGEWCEPDFDSAIQAESVGGYSQLRGFFD